MPGFGILGVPGIVRVFLLHFLVSGFKLGIQGRERQERCSGPPSQEFDQLVEPISRYLFVCSYLIGFFVKSPLPVCTWFEDLSGNNLKDDLQSVGGIGMFEVCRKRCSDRFTGHTYSVFNGFESVSNLQTKSNVLKMGKTGAAKRFGGFCRIIQNNDDVYGYKWRNWKMHLIELDNMNSEPQPLNVPRVYNLITDPKEEYNMAAEGTWLLPVMFKRIVAFQKTLIDEPPIQLGTPDPYEPSK